MPPCIEALTLSVCLRKLSSDACGDIRLGASARLVFWFSLAPGDGFWVLVSLGGSMTGGCLQGLWSESMPGWRCLR
jgi:hypothetical protein